MEISTEKNSRSGATTKDRCAQYSTFYVGERWYGIDVTRVQEIVRPMIMTTIPLAPVYVRGLINLRGQVATAIGLRELFELKYDAPAELMNVVCKHENALLSLQVDSIGDVVEVSEDLYESTPQTVAVRVKQFMAGIYKMPGQLLSIIDMDEVGKFLGAKTV